MSRTMRNTAASFARDWTVHCGTTQTCFVFFVRDSLLARCGAITHVSGDGAAHSRRCAVTARGVGCSKMSVGERVTPVSARSRDASSVAASESTPASMKGVSAVSEDADEPVMSRTMRNTAASFARG